MAGVGLGYPLDMSRSTTTKVSMLPAAALVVASMVGTGVFTSLGYQVRDIPSAPCILLVWTLGGLVALCGAFSYAELAAAMPRSGGEYHFIGRLYHPSLGWTAGLLSVVVGFAAPTALAALALGSYANRAVPELPPLAASVGALVLVTAGHSITLKASAILQTASTTLKLTLILAFAAAAFAFPGQGDIRWDIDMKEDAVLIARPAFAVALLFVFYAYSGWNAAVYMLEEIDNARQTVARALVSGTLLVTALYLLLNAAFLKAAPVAAMAGVTEVGHVAAVAVFGEGAARWFSGLLSLGLIATVSAMVWAGPRVLHAMGRDFPALRVFAKENRHGLPVSATLINSGFALAFVFTGDFDRLLTYTQFALTLCAFLAVLGVFILRRRGLNAKGGSRCPLRPLPPLVFLAMTGWVMSRSLVAEPWPTLAGMGTVLLAWLCYFPLCKLHRIS
jgi:basic amino acid/polyamine antiporter, APA family